MARHVGCSGGISNSFADIASMILAIDPGPVMSAWVLYADGKITSSAKEDNAYVLKRIENYNTCGKNVVIEMIEGRGMPVSSTVFETCVWIGKYIHASKYGADLIYRRDIKLNICGSSRAKDMNIRAALIDLVGPQGTKKSPGPTYGIKSDIWAALAVAVTWEDMDNERANDKRFRI